LGSEKVKLAVQQENWNKIKEKETSNSGQFKEKQKLDIEV
jgi:hypothetical protein